jgi:hypothetical protein
VRFLAHLFFGRKKAQNLQPGLVIDNKLLVLRPGGTFFFLRLVRLFAAICCR